MAVDFDQTAPTSQLSMVTGTGSAWDAATWDSGTWGGPIFSRSWQGASGVGYCAAPYITGTTLDIEANWIATDVVMEAGGIL